MHKFDVRRILISMKFASVIRRSFGDVADNLKVFKWRAIICAVICALGIALGVVLYNVSNQNWWCVNRCEYADMLYLGGFKSFFNFLITAAVFVTLLTFANMTRFCKVLSCSVLFVFSLYAGANSVALVTCFGVFGVLCVICVPLIDVFCYFLAVFVIASLQCCGNSSFRQSFCEIRQSVYVVLACLAVKAVCFFVILRIITAFI